MRLIAICGAVLLLGSALPAVADDDDRHDRWRDGRGYHGYWGHHDFDDDDDDDDDRDWGWYAEPGAGPCRVEREWRPNGAYREEIDCRGRPAYVPQLPAFVAPSQPPSLTIVIPID